MSEATNADPAPVQPVQSPESTPLESASDAQLNAAIASQSEPDYGGSDQDSETPGDESSAPQPAGGNGSAPDPDLLRRAEAYRINTEGVDPESLRRQVAEMDVALANQAAQQQQQQQAQGVLAQIVAQQVQQAMQRQQWNYASQPGMQPPQQQQPQPGQQPQPFRLQLDTSGDDGWDPQLVDQLNNAFNQVLTPMQQTLQQQQQMMQQLLQSSQQQAAYYQQQAEQSSRQAFESALAELPGAEDVFGRGPVSPQSPEGLARERAFQMAQLLRNSWQQHGMPGTDRDLAYAAFNAVSPQASQQAMQAGITTRRVERARAANGQFVRSPNAGRDEASTPSQSRANMERKVQEILNRRGRD